MNILQVEFKNRSGHTLRGVVTLPDVEGPVPFVVHLHGYLRFSLISWFWWQLQWL